MYSSTYGKPAKMVARAPVSYLKDNKTVKASPLTIDSLLEVNDSNKKVEGRDERMDEHEVH